MPRVANCPQCEHDLLVPDAAESNALVKCPQCRAFFELQHAESRELPAALLIEPHDVSGAASPERSKTPTVHDFSSLATVGADAEPISEAELRGESVEAETAGELGIGGEESAAVPPAHAADQPPQPNTESAVLEPSRHETPEEAAKRIDAWFRSAKTLSDTPQLDSGELSDIGRTIDIRMDDPRMAELSSDFELGSPSEPAHDSAAWDDSQHMDRLLSDLENQPVDSYEPTSHEATADTHEDQEHYQPAGDWTPDESLSISPGAGKPERKRSIVRTLVGSTVGGIIGLALAYYALLWLAPVFHRGPEIDFLELAKYLPKAVLPAVFRPEVKPTAAVQPSKMVADLAASEKVVDKAPPTPVVPAEKQATFTAPAEPAKKASDTEDRYAAPATKSEPVAKSEPPVREPAVLEAPPAKAITEITPKNDPVRIASAPSFAAADVTTALQAATDAQSALVTGNLQDGKEIQHAKGNSYMAIADLAQKATFEGSPSSAANATTSQQPVDEFFRHLLSSAHARDEVAQIVPKWLSHPKRPQNGVFFAGNVTHAENKGSVVEYNVRAE